MYEYSTKEMLEGIQDYLSEMPGTYYETVNTLEDVLRPCFVAEYEAPPFCSRKSLIAVGIRKNIKSADYYPDIFSFLKANRFWDAYTNQYVMPYHAILVGLKMYYGEVKNEQRQG